MRIQWIDQKEIIEKTEVKNRQDAIMQSSDLTPEQMIKKWTYLDYNKAKELIELLKHYSNGYFEGTGIELGAGTGIFSTILVENGLKNIYALEIVPAFTEYVIPVVTKHYLKENSNTVIPVLGSFDDIHLPNDSIDFAFEYDAFHHSNDLSITFNEIYKKLRPGGILIMVDRCHLDVITDEAIDKLLEKTYTKDFLTAHGYDENIILTRRENGEHEYRKSEWLDSIYSAGFDVKVFRTFYPKVNLKQLYWCLLSKIKSSGERGRSLMKIYLAQNFGIYLSDPYTLTSMKESIFIGKTIAVLEKPK
jgi:SAM-dependent methyltransferase